MTEAKRLAQVLAESLTEAWGVVEEGRRQWRVVPVEDADAAAALIRSQAAEIASAQRCCDSYAEENQRLSDKIDAQAAEIEALRAALIWYRDEAAALHKHLGSGAHTNAVLASVTVLALDAGARADAAIDAARQS